jgi:exonuclease VII small subunit
MAKTPTPTTHQPSFQDGLDSIWKFQLRKENAVLLENQEAQQKMLQALTAESTKVKKDFEERYSALEARLSNLENGEKGDRHAFETWREEMAMMKSQMSIMIANQERQFSEGVALCLYAYGCITHVF